MNGILSKSSVISIVTLFITIVLFYFYISSLESQVIVNVEITDISNKFNVKTNLNNAWIQETKPNEPQEIKYIAYGIHTGLWKKYQNFKFWKFVNVSEYNFAFNFTSDMYLSEDAMIEVMGYSKHVNLGDKYNTLDYYLVITGNLRNTNI